ncbi:MAG: winged helix-turn-helix transcriptional regulator [Thermodesulfobacteriota bacterium]
MINIDHSAFLLPTKTFRRLTILLTIHHAPRISQHKIAQETHLSSSMVNSYIKLLTTKGLITVSSRNNRDCNYQLTPQGKNELASLLMSYSAEIVQFYAQAKNEISNRIKTLLNGRQQLRFVLFGASATCELAMRALENFPQVEIAGIVDSQPGKQGEQFNGFTVQKPNAITSIKPDCVLITSYAKQDEIYDATKHLEKNGITVQRLTAV